MNGGWRDDAACRGADTDLFFPADRVECVPAGAAAYCAVCPVDVECREAGLGERGVWGGMLEETRRRAARGESPRVRVQGESKRAELRARRAVAARRREASAALLAAAGGIDGVLAGVAEATGVAVTDLRGDVRQRRARDARWAAMHLMYDGFGLSTSTVGMALRRDHTTVLHGVRRASAALREGQPPAEVICELMDRWSLGDRRAA